MTPIRSIVGFHRPAQRFPENSEDFLGFFINTLGERAVNRPLTEAHLASIETEAYQMLSIANDLYGLGVGSAFWVVRAQPRPEDPTNVTISVGPRVLEGRPVHIEPHENGGYLAELSGIAVRGPSVLEALVGLGRVFEVRGIKPSTLEAEDLKELTETFRKREEQG